MSHIDPLHEATAMLEALFAFPLGVSYNGLSLCQSCGLQGNPNTLTHPNALGSVENLKTFAHRAGRKFIKGIGQSKALYLKPVTE